MAERKRWIWMVIYCNVPALREFGASLPAGVKDKDV